ncbi:hypothetical protein ADUPG1_004565, partial [Aduncisulcus paluster]
MNIRRIVALLPV